MKFLPCTEFFLAMKSRKKMCPNKNTDASDSFGVDGSLYYDRASVKNQIPLWQKKST